MSNLQRSIFSRLGSGPRASSAGIPVCQAPQFSLELLLGSLRKRRHLVCAIPSQYRDVISDYSWKTQFPCNCILVKVRGASSERLRPAETFHEYSGDGLIVSRTTFNDRGLEFLRHSSVLRGASWIPQDSARLCGPSRERTEPWPRVLRAETVA